MPRLSFLAGTGDTKTVKKHLDKSLLFIVTLGLPICTGLYLLAPEIISVIAGNNFLPAVPVMRILALLPLAIGLSNLFCFQTLVPFNKEKLFLTAAIAGCIISISLNFLLIPSLSERGAAWANMITEITIAFITGWYAFKIIRFSIPAAVLIQTAVTCALFLPVVIGCRYLFSSSLYVLVAAMGSCVLLYSSLQYAVFKNTVTRETAGYFLDLLKLKK
jgi:O-antigen/teichoic acid export membrane protein